MSRVSTENYKDGSSYKGEYNDKGFKHGHGVLTLKTGDVYQGEFVASDMTGVGVMISADGSKYSGEFKGGKFDGLGTFESKDGTKFTGQFEASTPCFGLMTLKDGSHGKPKLSGKFVEGRFYEAADTEEMCDKAKEAAHRGVDAASKAAAL
mmetsp:Transcript_15818/g.40889  ORF Transcript_15818/g.40889 Transcript_15818/m.40889 type:complete len:151 (+) Transcript_15818:110-562(+)